MNIVGVSLLRDVQNEVLDEVLVTVPYNSASQFHDYFGTREVPPRFGASCAWQSFAAGRAVAERTGVKADYLIDGRHVAAVYREDSGLSVLDPYLLHGEPLRLARSTAEGSVVRVAVDAYPHRVRADGTPAPGKVRATWMLDDDSLRLDYIRFSPRRGHNVISRSFLLRPESRLDVVPPPADWVRPQLVHPEQHSVSVRALHPESRQLAELVLPLAQRPEGTLADVSALITKNNEGVVSCHGTKEFDRDLETVSDAVGAARADVVDVLLEGAALHRSAAPAGLELAPYSLEDE